MASTAEPRSGLSIKSGWSYGDDNYDVDLNKDLLDLAMAGTHPSVKDRDLATPPASPAAGDCYIVAGSPTGAWVGHATHIAIWYNAAWVFYTPRIGWLVYIEDEQKLSVFKASWSAGIAI